MVLERIVNMEYDQRKRAFVGISRENITEEVLGGSDACQVSSFNHLPAFKFVLGRLWRASDSIQKGQRAS